MIRLLEDVLVLVGTLELDFIDGTDDVDDVDDVEDVDDVNVDVCFVVCADDWLVDWLTEVAVPCTHW